MIKTHLKDIEVKNPELMGSEPRYNYGLDIFGISLLLMLVLILSFGLYEGLQI